MRPSKRDQLVRKALEVFYRNGFHATGMDMLVVETGVSKTSMYKYFKSKEELIVAVLKLRDENFRNWFINRIEELASTPRDKLIVMFDALREWFAQPDYCGCMFINASAEYQNLDHPIHMQAAEHKRLLFDYFLGLAKDTGASDPSALVRQLLLLKEGAIVTAHLGHTKDPAGDAKSAAQALAAEFIAQ